MTLSPLWDQLFLFERTQHNWACGPLTVPPGGSSWEGLLNSQQSIQLLSPAFCVHFCLNFQEPWCLREGLEYMDWESLGKRDFHCSYGEVTLCVWCRLPSAAVWGDPYAVSNPLPMSSKPNKLIGLCGETQGIGRWHISHYLKFSGT